MQIESLLSQESRAALIAERMKLSASKVKAEKWPDRHLHNEDNQPIPFHTGQNLVFDSTSRIVAMLAGSQAGKTAISPWWIYSEMNRLGGGDYLAVTSTYDLFKLKFLPAMLAVFEQILGIGRYWAGDKVIEIKDPKTNTFLATKSTDPMYARIILRSADALQGLESSTAKAAVLDECGMDKFTFGAYKAIRRRLALSRGRILMTTTLYNFGWIVQHILDVAVKTGDVSFYYENGGEIQKTVSKQKDITVIQLDSIVNPQFPKEEFTDAAELLSEEEFNMFYRGRKSTRRFLIYDVFDPEKHVCTTPFKISDSWKRYWGMDYGGEHMAVIFLAEEPTTKRLYVYREYMAGGKDVAGFTDDIVKGEISPFRAYGGSKSEENWRRELRWHGTSVEQPTIIDVNLGISRTYTAIKNDGIIFFSDVKGIIDELGRYRRVRNENGEATDEILDKNTFHRLDALRYIVSSIRPGVSLRAKAINVSEVIDYE